jgi:hypothetical protein
MSYLHGNRLRQEVELVSARSKRLFKPAEWKRVLRLAGWTAGMTFIDNFLPLRWAPEYARRAGYSGKGGDDTIPYYERGRWVRNAMKASPRVSVSGERLKLKVPVPIGHAITPRTSKDFRKITEAEREAVAGAFFVAVSDLIERGTSKRIVTGRVGSNNKSQYMTKWVRRKNGKVVKKRRLVRAKTKRTTLYGYTRKLSDQDRAMSRMISQRGGFRAGRVATELEARAATLRQDRKLLVKDKLTRGQLKRLHQQWARTAGGAAGPTGQQILSGQTTSQTYAGSRKQRHAEAQRRYRDKYRSGRRSTDSGTAGANAFISSSI